MPTWLLFFVAVTARVLLMPSHLIQENDVYRYVLDGQNLSRGQNPYLFSPTEARHQVGHPLGSEFETPAGSTVLDRIGYPEIPTIYPPLAQVCFAAGVALADWDWRGQRYVFSLLDLLVIAFSLSILGGLGVRREWVVLYAWNPLVLKEVANSAHLDVLVSLFLVCVVFVALRLTGVTRVALSLGLLIGCLILSKLYPVIFLPAVCIWLYRRVKSMAACLLLVTAAVGAVVAGYLPFLGGSALESMKRGLSAYGGHWVMNEGVFSLLEVTTSNPRAWVYLLILGISIWWSCRVATSTGGLVVLLQGVMLVWVLFIPTVFPWYALPLIALSALNPDSIAARMTPLLSLLLAAYYLNFYVSYQHMNHLTWTIVRASEHVLLWAWLLALWWKKRQLVEQA